MKKMKINLAFAIILSTILVSCQTSQNSNTQEAPAQGENTQSEFSKKISQLDKEILESESFNSCILPNINSCEVETVKNMASEKKDLEVCNKLKEKDQQEACKVGLILSNNLEENKIENCEMIKDSYMNFVCKVNFINVEATTTLDIKTCDKIGEINYEDEEEKKYTKDNCYQYIITNNKNSKVEDCDILSQEENKNLCKTTIENRIKESEEEAKNTENETENKTEK